ncbi:hypothetical protein [Brevundimonas sp.]|uniref:hypothetical protein n=1 Tax=Brevundimonas sp. TaxID=1871086 RepID=UPI003D6D7141
MRLTAALCLTTALLSAPALAQEAAPVRDSTPFTLSSGTPRTPEQLALRFDKADLSFKLLPETQSIEGVAILDFTATAPAAAVVVELDTLFAIAAIAVDGQTIAGWSNPEGRLTIPLPRPLAAGRTASIRIAYAGRPHQAQRAPWDGGFVWSTTPDAHTLRLYIGDDAFYESLRRLVYGRPDPRPGNFQPRYATTPEFIAIVNAVTGRDLNWFFDAYLYQAALPDLVMTRDGERMTLEWKTGAALPFPLPVEVEVDGRLRTLAMTDGRASFTAPATAHILLDPGSKVLRRLDYLEVWKASQAPAAAH